MSAEPVPMLVNSRSNALYIADDITLLWNGITLKAFATPEDVNGDLVVLLGRLATMAERWGQREVTVLLDTRMATELGFPRTAREMGRDPERHPLLERVRNYRWHVSKLSPWMSFRRKHSRPVALHFGLLGFLSERTFPFMINGQTTDPGHLVYLCGRYQELMGVAYRATPGTSASAALQELWTGAEPMWHPSWELCTPALSRTTERPYFHWSPREGDRKCLSGCAGYRADGDHVALDLHRAYLAAAATMDTAFGVLRPAQTGEFDRRKAGFWLVDVPPWNETRLPHPMGPGMEPGMQVWTTTPSLALVEDLADQGLTVMPRVHRAYVPANSSGNGTKRVLRKWAERLDRAADIALTDPSPIEGAVLEDVIKSGYKEAFGMWLNNTGRIWRPDWSHHVVGMARANLFRKMLTASRANFWPIHVHVDEITYAGTDLPPNVKISRKLGGFKPPREIAG